MNTPTPWNTDIDAAPFETDLLVSVRGEVWIGYRWPDKSIVLSGWSYTANTMQAADLVHPAPDGWAPLPPPLSTDNPIED